MSWVVLPEKRTELKDYKIPTWQPQTLFETRGDTDPEKKGTGDKDPVNLVIP